MSKALSFVKLDFITVKPYITPKNLVLFLVIAFVMGMGVGGGSAVIGIFAAYGALYVSFPFAVGEQNGIDTLYATLSISRGDVVSGRYIFAVCVSILACAVGYTLSFMLAVFQRKAFDPLETLAVAAAVFFIFGFIQAFQLPIYFKYGYAMAKFLAYLPFIVFPLIVFLFSSVLKGSNVMPAIVGFVVRVAANPAMSVAAGLIAWALALYVSYRISLSFYTKRDF